MSVPTDLFSLLPGTLPGGDNYCWLGWQRYYVDMFARARVVQRNDVGTTFWNVSAATPTADKRIYPWLNLNDGRVYVWSLTFGMWISPRPFSFGQLLPPGLGITETQLWGLDGGDGTDPRPTLPDGSVNPAYVAPTVNTGAMWMFDHSMDGRFALGPGTILNSGALIPGSNPPAFLPNVTVAPGATVDSSGTSGEYSHVLTQQEGGIALHTHKYGIRDLTASAAAFSVGAAQTVAAYQARYIGGNAPQNPTETTADLETLAPLAADGTPLTSIAFNKMPPFAGVPFIMPTARIFYTVLG